MPRSIRFVLFACILHAGPAWSQQAGSQQAGSQQAGSQPAACPEFFPLGAAPVLTNAKLQARTTLLCNDAFAVLASGVTRGPLWSAEHLTASGVAAARGTPRQGEFHPDDRLAPEDRAELDDYRDSGWDRGHMAPSGDMPDERAQQQSFSLANMVPQAGALNRGIWAEIEMAVRGLAQRRGGLFVLTGPAFAGAQVQAIGRGVLVPSATWKAVYDPRTRRAGVYVCANQVPTRCAVVAVDDMAAMTGIDPFPAMPAAARRTAMPLPQPASGHARRRPPQRSVLEQLFGY